MKNQGEQLDIVINQTAEQMRIDNWEGADREKVIKTIVSFVEENVKSEGWSLIDEDGVSWFLGIYCKAFVRSLRYRQESFDAIFKQCFKEYFKNH